MIKCKDGRRTCSCFCTSRNYELGADTINKSLTIVDDQDYSIADVAYIRGLENHPDRGHSEQINNMVEALFLTETPDPPQEETTTDDSQNSESDYAADRPDSPRQRRASSTNYGLLDESDDDEVPPYTVQPGPSRNDGFAAILAATRDAARDATPGPSTREAPPAATPPADHQTRDNRDDTPSPLHTRAGTIRTAPPGPKKRRQRDK